MPETDGESGRANASAPPEPGPAVHGRRLVAIILQAGSVAAALSSIVGLVVVFAPGLRSSGGGGDNERATTVVLSQGQEIKLAIAKDHVPARVTYGRYLELEEEGSTGIPTDELRTPGADVHYRVEMRGYGKGAPFRTRFTLSNQGGVAVHEHEAEATLDADSDECRCTEFVPVPVSAQSYRVEVAVFRPGAPYAAPVVAQYTNWFSGSAPVRD